MPHLCDTLIKLPQSNCTYCEDHRYGYLKVIDHGTYFFPAWKHYGRQTIVVCDRCNESHIKACIGFDDKDLCLSCADELTRGLIN